MTNEEFDAIMEGTIKELSTQQSWLDKQKDNVDHIYKLMGELKGLEDQLRREREERVLERDTLEKQLAEARAALAANESQAWLGNATTGELLEELKVRAEIHGYASYRTVDSD